jgi:hypothetical protein
MSGILSIFLFFATLLVSTTTTTTSTTQIVDLTNDSMVTAGIGFSFTSSNATATAKNYVTLTLPKCKIGTLDALYFYIYGCTFPTSFMTDLSNNVGQDFLYSSDKSLTLITTTPTSLLLGNVWQFELFYDLNDDLNNYSTDFDRITSSKGCVVHKEQSSLSNFSLVVGCGSMTCSGCNLVDFYTTYHFLSAKFLVE